MTKRLFLLNGLAILAVVCSHAISWGFIAISPWADHYRPVTEVNSGDRIGTLPYFVMFVVSRLGAFSVPAFLFVSGFFMAYTARGSQSTLSWKMVTVRLRNLLIPYLIWSVVIFIGDALQGITYAPLEYLERIALGRAHAVYFYVPLLCQFYLLSPLVIPLAKTKWKLLLLVSALLQVSVLSLRYLILFEVEIPALRPTTDLLFPMYAFFLASGVVSGFHLRQLRQWLVRVKWGLLTLTMVLGVLTIIESEVIYRLTGLRRGAGPTTLPASLYAVAFVFCFLAFYQVSIPFSKRIYRLGSASFGIYLLHSKVLEFVARAIRKFAPWMLACQALFQPVLIILAVGGPLLFMTMVSKSPMRKAYRYLFG